jgi:hypothetical protein
MKSPYYNPNPTLNPIWKPSIAQEGHNTAGMNHHLMYQTFYMSFFRRGGGQGAGMGHRVKGFYCVSQTGLKKHLLSRIFLWYWDLNSGSAPSAILPALFFV